MLGNKRYVSKEEQIKFDNSLWGRYLKKVRSNSFVYFGIPCFAMMLVGTHYMTQFASVRYEQHDRRQQELSQEEALKREGKQKRKVDMREEYYRLQHMDLDSWEQKRVRRLPGESENKW